MKKKKKKKKKKTPAEWHTGLRLQAEPGWFFYRANARAGIHVTHLGPGLSVIMPVIITALETTTTLVVSIFLRGNCNGVSTRAFYHKISTQPPESILCCAEWLSIMRYWIVWLAWDLSVDLTPCS